MSVRLSNTTGNIVRSVTLKDAKVSEVFSFIMDAMGIANDA